MSELWTPPPRSTQAQAVYAAAEADRISNPEKYQLDAEQLVHVIEKQLGKSLSTPQQWREGMLRYLNSAQEDANLNALGTRAAAGTVMGRLTARSRIEQWWQEHGEVDGSTQLKQRPIFIIGGWRTGTTFLQRLLHSLPGIRGLYPFELSAPWKAANASSEVRARLQQGAQAAHDRLHLLNSRIQQVHDSGADLPEECVLALGTSMKNWGFLSTMRLSQYSDWLQSQDLSPEYETYGKVLSMLETDDDTRFVLKAPAHTAELQHILKVFPDALIVHLHRDVVETVASGASLFAVFRATYCDSVDAVEVGDFQTRQTHMWFERARQFRIECDAEGRGHFLDVSYQDLIADPASVVRQIITAVDMPMTVAAEHSVQHYLGANRQHKHGAHQYTPEQFGLVPDELRALFKDYRQHFNVS